jgi:hypothetical protein
VICFIKTEYYLINIEFFQMNFDGLARIYSCRDLRNIVFYSYFMFYIFLSFMSNKYRYFYNHKRQVHLRFVCAQ